MLASQPIKPHLKGSPLTYFAFLKNNLRSIIDFYEIFKNHKTLGFHERQSTLISINDMWNEFINEPCINLDLALLKRSRSAYAYALLTLYAHMSKCLLRPNQGYLVDDQKAIQSILHFLINVFHDPIFISKLDSARRNQQKTRDSLVGYASDLKTIYPKLMVIRVDFGYKQAVSKSSLSLERIENDWEQLLLYVKTKFSDSFAGYAVKFEHGEAKGLHAHSVFFLNGNVVRTDARIARIFGEYWESEVTQGLGVHFNCNTSDYKATLKVCGLGTFTGQEPAFRDGMWIIADYLSKPDVMVRLMLPERTKIFRRGALNERQKIKLETVRKKQAMQVSRPAFLHNSAAFIT
ncbi:hypothetical protein ACFIQG_13410 [Comamonas odontotermitis]|uniref:hypothetical protein n=1 Tax=Comamonas odontotermitis TaxID=379895 RepID=UPI00366DCB43